jgi:ketosteroid isomerase-like protein
MLTRRKTAFVVLGLGALSGGAFGQTGTEDHSPETAVRALLSAMEANDAEGIRKVFSPGASQAYGSGAPKAGQAFSRWLQSDIVAVHGRVEDPRLVARGDEVVVTGRYRNNAGYSSAANFLFTVRNGQIVSWRMRY